MADYKSGYPVVEKLCAPCGQVKPMPQRNRFCSIECSRASRRAAIAQHSAVSLAAPRNGVATHVEAPITFKHPTGWEPYVEEVGDTAVAISQPMFNRPSDEELIRGWQLDPNEWVIDGTVNCRRWEAIVPVKDPSGKTIDYQKQWLYYYKANLVRSKGPSDADIQSLVDLISTFTPETTHFPAIEGDKGEKSFVVVISDLQLGKSDGGGTEGIVKRFLDAIEGIEQRILDLRFIGHSLPTLYILGLGDLIENCDGHYAQQAFSTDFNRRHQVNIARRLVLKAIERWSPLFERVVVAAIAGNHGENRKDGKSFTDFADNDDVAIFDQLEDAFAMNPDKFGHVSFKIPQNDLTLTLDINGVIVGIAHGHQAGKTSGTAGKKLTDWWKNQAYGNQPIGNAKILITGHFHHLIVNNDGDRTHIQAPSLEGGSDWYKNLTGRKSHPGVLTMMIGENCGPLGFSGTEVL